MCVYVHVLCMTLFCVLILTVGHDSIAYCVCVCVCVFIQNNCVCIEGEEGRGKKREYYDQRILSFCRPIMTAMCSFRLLL